MAKSRKQKQQETFDGVAKWTASIFLVALGVILIIAAFKFGAFGIHVGNGAGILGDPLFGFTFFLLGAGAFIFPFSLMAGGVMLVNEDFRLRLTTTLGGGLVAIALLAFLGIVNAQAGGFIGTYLGHIFSDLFGVGGALVLLVALIAVGLVISSDIVMIIETIAEWCGVFFQWLSSLRLPTLSQREDSEKPLKEKKKKELPEEEDIEEEDAEETVEEHHAEPEVKMFDTDAPKGTKAPIPDFDATYNAPPTSLLGGDSGKPGVGDIKANANIIRRTFQNFGISVEMDEVSVGPTVTRYAIKPAEGVRLSKIISLQNNLELALAAHPVRIEAPIPGKSLVGIEVPNVQKATVGLGGVLSSPLWTESEKPLLAAIGRDITGTPHYANIAKMPHALIAGATGSGKSVAIHALITSLLYRNGPNQLRFIMIDPKRVELTLYNGIPHLLTPVITDPKKTIMALKWAAKEMDRRYNILESEAVRDIDSYHKTVVEPAKKKGGSEMPESLPYIVIVIDELADIMQSYPRELEAGIVRLAQMSRAVGIHLLLSTQRPSVNVITGLIKANVPTRMALQVASQIDSRTILDTGGAETLLGAGDMLYLSSDMQKPVRIQTAYIAEAEVKKVVSYIKQHNAGSLASLDLGGANGTAPSEPNDAMMLLSDAEGDVDDDLYTDAREAVEEAGKASTSYLQRKLRIGYSRAARLMDILEEKGVIGAADGSRPRDVLTRGAVETSAQETEEE